MAVQVSDTKHFKKGEKLPDGTTAKRGVVWNTKTGKRVTGKVLMASAGQGGMGATKSYKGGRSVKPKVAKSAAPKKSAPPKRVYDKSRDEKPRDEKSRDKGNDNGRKSYSYTPGTGGGAVTRRMTAAGKASQRRQASFAAASEKRRGLNAAAASRKSSTGRASAGNGSPAAAVRQSVVNFFRGRSSGSSRPTTATGTSGVSASAYKDSMRRYEAAKAARAAKAPEKPKVTKKTDKYIYYANGTKKKIS